ncbi:MAG: hypothetical protein AB8B88_10880 [Devosiaceae bacterium]
MIRRIALSLLALAATTLSASAWQASSGEVCQITHSEAAASVSVTYDLDTLDYAIAITPDEPWEQGPVFALRFDGPFNNIITTDRHQLSDGNTTLTVTDQGFGNVLDGLTFNDTATAVLGEQQVMVSLEGAADAVRAFRACTQSLAI